MADATDEKQKPKVSGRAKPPNGAARKKARPKKYRRRGGAYPFDFQ